MSIDSNSPDAYAAVLADLRAKRAQIDQTITLLETMNGVTVVSSVGTAAGSSAAAAVGEIVETAGMFLGMSIVDASKKLLAMRKRTLGNVEIAAAIQEGGLVLKSAEPANVVGSVLSRRFQQVGDVVKVGRGIWGLKEWYPNRTFKPLGKGVSLISDAATNKPLGFQDDSEPESGPGAVHLD